MNTPTVTQTSAEVQKDLHEAVTNAIAKDEHTNDLIEKRQAEITEEEAKIVTRVMRMPENQLDTTGVLKAHYNNPYGSKGWNPAGQRALYEMNPTYAKELEARALEKENPFTPEHRNLTRAMEIEIKYPVLARKLKFMASGV